MLTRTFSALFVVASLLACSDPIGPPVPSGLYVLERVSGVSLPAVIHEDAVHRYITVADSLTVRPDGSGEQSSVQRVERIDGGGAPYTVSWQAPIGFRSARGRLVYVRGCPINANCARSAPIAVRRTADGLAFTVGDEQREYRAAPAAP